ncbi:MAG: phosphotransferase family protein [Deltaproteobacteria bacterium]|nr:phosphotransferase family protein [Deltaproteobacteria bacterium]MBW2047275.1 phosphotransferase family protein [Deltaproteobacteria bacterium]MBW2112253.1 phosphotransferase family protein [Deltaproteobacteria bacterium]MBW2352705.1 phosphotransferase family protein [Deltaproteobacteria bacterium]
MDLTDRPSKIREGEGFETGAVEKFLREKIEGLEGNFTVEQFPSGFSNLTYMIRVGRRELVLRMPPHGTKARTAHDMGREYRILRALHPVFPYAPTPFLYTEDTSIMGSPFYVMERIQGIILRKDLPGGLNMGPDKVRRLCENLVDVHLELHSIDYREVGLADFGRPEGYVKRQVEGWSKRYRAARTGDAPGFERVMEWLHHRIPEGPARSSVIHNDYKLDNVVLDPENPLKIIGILDWEMATIGDPLMDLGNSLAYWVERDDPEELQAIRLMPTNIPGALTREELVDRYVEKSGISVDSFDFYYTFGLFRLAVIAQQIYYRYYHGQTSDERFKTLIVAVNNLEKRAMGVIEGYS